MPTTPYGLDPTRYQSTTSTGISNPGTSGILNPGINAPSAYSAYNTKPSATYQSDFGTFRETPQGWAGGSGNLVWNLPGYLEMQQQRKEGSQFGDIQNQLTNLLRDPSSIQQTPGYQFAVDQGNQAINRSAAASGMLGSGNVLAELQKYGQGMASKEYGTQVNRLADLLGQAQQFGISSGYYAEPTYSSGPGATPLPGMPTGSQLSAW